MKYFICFKNENGICNCETIRQEKIKNIDDIREVESNIAKESNSKKVLILNYILF